MQTLLWAAGGTGFTFFMTALGAAVVFFFKERINSNIQRIFLGFAAGGHDCCVGMEPFDPCPSKKRSLRARSAGFRQRGGFLLGIGFLMLLDIFCPICIQMRRSRKGLPAPGNGQPCWCWR